MSISITKLDESFSVSGQISPDQLREVAAAGFRSVVCNRPDGEGGAAQPTSAALAKAAADLGLKFAYFPVTRDELTPERAVRFQEQLRDLPTPILTFCGSGARSTALCKMARQNSQRATSHSHKTFDVVVVGGGSAGISVTASLLRRRPSLDIAVIEPNDNHYYQPAWTLVGAGSFEPKKTVRPMSAVMPKRAAWVRGAVSTFEPDSNRVVLADGTTVSYRQLIVCTGLQLAWDKIEGLEDALGKNGVTSNYRYDLAPYTWQTVSNLKRGKAIFSQPALPIKCAGAPQKAMYLSCDHWQRQGVLKNIDVEFDTAGGALFGVATFVPPLMKYVERYNAKLVFNSNLVKIDGENKLAWFDIKDAAGNVTRQSKSFDMLHVVPPQVAPEVIRRSAFADAAGWFEVDHATLRHPRYENVFALGDVCSAPNAKTAAAARKQVVVVSENVLAARDGKPLATRYDGYGSCPLTVEKGKVVLAEFGYGGKLLPTLPLNPTVPRGFAWFLKASFLPWFYWNGMLKGKEWLARPSEG